MEFLVGAGWMFLVGFCNECDAPWWVTTPIKFSLPIGLLVAAL